MKYTIYKFLKTKPAREILGENYTPSADQERRFNFLISKYSITRLSDWRRAICFFILYDLTNYYGRIRRLLLLGSANGKYACILRYGKKEGLLRAEHHRSYSLKNLSNTKDFWLARGLSEDDALIRISQEQKIRSEISAAKTRGSSEHSIRCVAFWMKKGFSESEAKLKVSEIQRRKHTKERNERWQRTLKSKPNEEISLINKKKSNSISGIMLRGYTLEEAVGINERIFHGKPRGKFAGSSKISQRMFEMISNHLGYDGLYYSSLNYEKNFMGKLVDFYDQHSKVVIEYLGDWFHSNPLKYAPEYQHRPGLYACHIRLDDKKRHELIIQDPRVENVYYVWDSEFRENPSEVVNLIVQFIKDKRTSAA